MTPSMLYRTGAIAEAITWTLLIGALIIRATTGFALGVSIAGGVHGFVFLAYSAVAILTAINQRWGVGLGVLALVTAIVPYATIPFDVWAKRTGRLEGTWHRDATDDPRDERWVTRSVRLMLRHPLLLTALIALAVAVLFTVLLALGPPTAAITAELRHP